MFSVSEVGTALVGMARAGVERAQGLVQSVVDSLSGAFSTIVRVKPPTAGYTLGMTPNGSNIGYYPLGGSIYSASRWLYKKPSELGCDWYKLLDRDGRDSGVGPACRSR